MSSVKYIAHFIRITVEKMSSSTGSTMKGTLDPEDGEVTFTRKKLKKDDVEVIDNPECSTSRTTVHNLPPELLMEIFSCFSVRELCVNISPVCKIWHLLSRHHGLWKHLSFEGQRVTTGRLCILLSHATQLQSLQIVDRVDATAVLRQVAHFNRRLQIIIVKRCSGSPLETLIPEEVLLKLVKSCSKLVEINLKHTQFYSDQFFKLMAIALPDLKRINFDLNEYFGSRSLNIIACNYKPLEEVCVCWGESFRSDYPNVYEKDIRDNDISELCTRMKNSLKILKIVAQKLTDNAIKSIVQCTCLHTLSISIANRLSNDGILLLATLHNLSSLQFTGANGVTSEGWHELFIRSKWNSLRKLYLVTCYGVNDNVLETIAGTCSNLQSIDISNCGNFTQEGFSKLIKACNKIIYLRFNMAQINVCQCFPLIPTYTPNLRCLIYCTFNIGIEKQVWEDARRMLYDLQEKLPHLEICSDLCDNFLK